MTTSRAALPLALLLTMMTSIASAATVRGTVRSKKTQAPLVDVLVGAQSTAAEPKGYGSTTTDLYGYFELKDVPAGEALVTANLAGYKSGYPKVTVKEPMTVVDVLLEPTPTPNGAVKIDVTVTDIRTNAALPNANVTLERYADAGAAGAPLESLLVYTPESGHVSVEHLTPGNYRITMARFGYTSHAAPKTGTVKVTESQWVVGALEPLTSTLKVDVMGGVLSENQPESWNQPLAGALVKVIGMDATRTFALTPPRVARTNSDGHVEFQDLGFGAWDVTVSRPGYVPSTVAWNSDGTTQPPSGSFSLMSSGTTIDVVVTSPFAPGLLAVETHLYGAVGSPNEGRHHLRFANHTLKQADGSQIARFKDVWPGPYTVVVTGYTQAPPLASKYGAVELGYYNAVGRIHALHTNVEVAEGEKRVVTFDAVPERATLQGRLELRESQQLGVVHGNASFLYAGSTTYDDVGTRKRVQAGIELELVPVALPLADGKGSLALIPNSPVVKVTTDADGRFSADVLPGRYGVRAPQLSQYTGALVRLRGLGQDEVKHGWPYADPWPYAVFPEGLVNPFVGPPLPLSSGKRLDADLQVRRRAATVIGTVNGGGPGLIAVATIHDASSGTPAPECVLEGAAKYSSKATPPVYLDIPPGDYTLSCDEAQQQFKTPEGKGSVTVTVPDWPATGVVPLVDPKLGKGLWAGQALQTAPALNGVVPPKSSDAFTVTYHTWTENEVDAEGKPVPPYYKKGAPVAGANVLGVWSKVPEFPGVLVFGYWTNATLVAIRQSEKSYYVLPGAASGFEIHVGGPTATPLSGALGLPSAIATTVFAVTEDGEDLPGLPVDLHTADSVLKVTSGTPFTLKDAIEGANAAAVTAPEWETKSRTLQFESLSPPVMRIIIRVARQMAVKGKVTRAEDGAPVAGQTVRLLSRFGGQLFETTTLEDGSYAFGVPWQPVIVSVERRGRLPYRARFEAAVGKDLVGLDISLQPLPPLAASAFTVDRHGLFLPGTTMTGTFGAGTDAGATAALTTAWSVTVTADPLTYIVAPFDGLGDPAVSAATIVASDAIQDVWLIDRRAFPKGSLATIEDPTNPTDPAKAKALALPAATLEAVEAFLATLRHDAQPSPGTVFQRRGGALTAGTVGGEVLLSELPAGPVSLAAIVVSQRGRVAVVPFTPAAGQKPLVGAHLPEWIARVFNTARGLAILGTNADPIGLTPTGLPFPLPKVETSIDEKDGAVSYATTMTVPIEEGMLAPSLGLLGLGGPLLGVAAEAELSLQLDGVEGTLKLGGQATLSKELVTATGANLPGLVRNAKTGKALLPLSELSLTPSATGSITLIESYAGATTFPDVAFQLTLDAFLEAGLHVDASDAFIGVPGVGWLLKLAKKSGIGSIRATLGFGAGGKLTSTYETVRPKPVEGTPTSDGPKPERVGPFGGREIEQTASGKVAKKQVDVTWKASLGLSGSAFGDAVSLNGALQLGAPDGSKDKGVLLTLNPALRWPLFTRIQGAVSLTGSLNVEALGLAVAKDVQLDLLPFDVQLGSEPYALFLTPKETTTVTSALDGAAAQAGVAPTEPVVGLAAQAKVSWPGGANAVVTAEPSVGTMVVRVYRSTATPPVVEVPTSGLVVDLATATLASGELLVVWSEADAADLGNVSAPTRLKSVRVTATGAGAPETVLESTNVLHTVKLARVGDVIALAFLEATSGLSGATQTVWLDAGDGTVGPSGLGTGAGAVSTTRDVRELILGASATHGTLAVVGASGDLSTYSITPDGTIAGLEAVATGVQRAAVGAATSGPTVLAWVSDAGALTVAEPAKGGGAWLPHAIAGLAALGPVAEVAMASAGGTAWMTTWVPADRTVVRGAQLSATFGLEGAPFDVLPGVIGPFRGLRLAPGPAGADGMIRSGAPTQTVRTFTLVPGVPPQPPADTPVPVEGSAEAAPLESVTPPETVSAAEANAKAEPTSASEPTASADVAAGPAPASGSEDSGCQSTGSGAGLGPAVALLALAFGLVHRRRRGEILDGR